MLEFGRSHPSPSWTGFPSCTSSPAPPACVPFGNPIWHLQMTYAGNAAVTKRDTVSAFWRTAHKWEEKSTR